MNKDIFNCLIYSIAGDIIGFSNGGLKYNNNSDFQNGILTKDDEDFLIDLKIEMDDEIGDEEEFTIETE